MGLATSTPPVDQDPGAGLYAGAFTRDCVFTRRTPVIFNFPNASANMGTDGSSVNKDRRVIIAIQYTDSMPSLPAAAFLIAATAFAQDHKTWSDYGGASDFSQYSALNQINRTHLTKAK